MRILWRRNRLRNVQESSKEYYCANLSIPPITNIFLPQVSLAKFVLIKGEKFERPKDRNLKFYTFEKINDLPKPVLITRFLCDHKNFYS